MVSSYLRMTWKISNYNSLRSENDKLRSQYLELQRRRYCYRNLHRQPGDRRWQQFPGYQDYSERPRSLANLRDR